MRVSGRTQIVGIFGDPVAHSLSPLMQNAAIMAAGLDAVFVPFHVKPAQLCDAISGMRAMNIRGVNLTIPHKEAACQFVDEIDEQAELIGAINTIVNDNGRLKGYNTDGAGLLKALRHELSVEVAGKRVLLVGAGGACRAALVALCRAGVSGIGLANRTRERSQKLIKEFSPLFEGTTFAEYELSRVLCKEYSGKYDLLINTTSVGLKADSFAFPLVDCVSGGGAVYDMVYTPESTSLVRDASARGLSAADGKGMLAGQGALAYELWFGTPPLEHVMRAAIT